MTTGKTGNGSSAATDKTKPAVKPTAKPEAKPASARGAIKAAAAPASKTDTPAAVKAKAAPAPSSKTASTKKKIPAAAPTTRPVVEKAVVAKPVVEKAAKPAKAKKAKLVRDSFTMPEGEYAQFAALKKRCLNAGRAVRKSEILRAALAGLSVLDDAAVVAAIQRLNVIKAGRPGK